jgi:hypothetical protein
MQPHSNHRRDAEAAEVSLRRLGDDAVTSDQDEICVKIQPFFQLTQNAHFNQWPDNKEVLYD